MPTPTQMKPAEYFDNSANPVNNPAHSRDVPWRVHLTKHHIANSVNSISGVSGMMKTPVITKQ